MKNIYQKINEVMKNIEYLAKDDQVAFGTTKYKAISEEKVTTAVREQLVKQGIVILPVQQESVVSELIRTDKSVNQRADVHTRYRIQNIEDKEDYIEVESNGSGVDTQDKAVGKAMTYAYKYMLLRTFAIPTGEDPDKISSAETDAKIKDELETEKLKEQLLTENEIKILEATVKKYNKTETDTMAILMKYGYKEFKEVKKKDYAKIGNDLSK